MKMARAIAGALGAVVVGSAFAAMPAQAATVTDTYPETPRFNPQLPLIHTAHGSDHLEANILNARPVCNASQDKRTVVYKVTDQFLPVGTISATNLTDTTIPLTQTTSRTQQVSMSVNGSQTETISFNGGGSGTNPSEGGGSTTGNAGIAWSLAKTIGGNASYSLSWTVGQTVGPYEVPSGYTGEATYGFRAVTMSGTQQFCLANGTWSTPTAWNAFVPIKNEVRVKMYNSPAGAIGGIGDTAQQPTTPISSTPVGTVTGATPDASETGNAAHDLTVGYTVSGLKAEGYAGSVALRVKNVGSDRYYAEYPGTSFLVTVKTEKGPQGVDRLITTGNYNGAYLYDMGFDPATSTRTFLMTLANPVKAGEEQLVGHLSFADGLTSEGRLVNSIEVTQVGRLADDKTAGNDQFVSSKDATRFDTGGVSRGLF